ncbi:MAG: dTDP-glucose 4,6-dehydratase [Candidatus Marinimicrobia bacterium]|nr:dTDP-glucose 4,6-dehydratase [Candidatus Neomarinimicrobiota bacterium]
MKKILVTGGSGFIGSNFIISQINNNIILNFDKLTYAANPSSLSSCSDNSNYHFIHGDITDYKKLTTTINDFKPDSIVNFAAESHVDRSIDGPKEFINTNIIGTYELLQSSLKYYESLSQKNKENFRLLHVSTDEVYGSLGKDGYFKETTPYDPSSPYSASKASSDHLVKAWFHTFNLPILITNCSNNYGPFQFPEKLIPLMIIKCLKQEKLPIYGDGKNIRDWLYVNDHCDAIYTVLDKGDIGETYNIGGNQEKTNIEIVNTICDSLDEKTPSKNLNSYKDLITYVKDRPGHDFRYAIDASKIKDKLNWEPNYKFEKAILKTVDWYLDNQSWWENILNDTYSLKRLGEN